MSYEELHLAAYETLLISSRFLIDLSKDDLEATLAGFRTLFKISESEHEEAIVNLMVCRIQKLQTPNTSDTPFILLFICC